MPQRTQRPARRKPAPQKQGKFQLERGALNDPQPETFRQTWLANPGEMPFYDYGFDGELVPAEEWLGDAGIPGYEVYGQLGEEDFSLVLSGDLVEFMSAQLPEPVLLGDATSIDRALLLEHFLTPLLTVLEDTFGREVSFSGAEMVEPADVPIDVYGMLNSSGGGFPVGLVSQSPRFWALLHTLNTKRVSGLVKREVQISFGSVILMPEDLSELGPGDVIVLEEAQGPELQGDLLVEGQSAHAIIVTPSKAVIVKAPEEEEIVPHPDDYVLSFVPAKLAMTDNEILALKPGAELPFKRPENGAVEILCNGKRAGAGNLVLQDGCMGIKVKEITF
ncbi:FliM/FliN family flagellar motor switch protein [Roseibium sediminis]|uniref:FliM/FliN family flagellar motor switch protein n=1 Tax=Roseibium sediminis TaxID=1775174 RepID=UPI001376272A|nr:FliM/FliN family flagellar motor switch protein [Roseibium sediminis]